MNPHYPRVADRAAHCCEYCRAPEKMFNSRHEVEHITPFSIKPDASFEDLALACRSCNMYKSFFRSGKSEDGTVVELFNPRCDRWEDHFVFDSETATFSGITPIGEATINRLQLNSREQIRARTYWMRLDQFP